MSSGQPSVEKGQSRTEPGVQHIFILGQFIRAAFGADRWIFFGANHLAAFTVPNRNTVSPPNLARDTPFAAVFHPVKINLVQAFGVKFYLAGTHGFDSGRGKFGHVHKPLRREIRLDNIEAVKQFISEQEAKNGE